ncbi:MAG: lipid-A-disaccharide synthase [Paracoccaceae bacterium]|jgi:lipid-A-disaccharide synthase
MSNNEEAPLIWLIAGEPSGDLIGARLIEALNKRAGGHFRITGIGGEAMESAGLQSRFPISDIAVMGLIEIIPRIPLIKRRMRETIAQIKQDKPAIVVSIDVPGFCYDVWKGLRGSGIPLVHYVAPTVWAWRPDRAKKFARELDHLMALLPFEPPYFEVEGLDCTFVGHPVLEGGADKGDGARFREQHGIAPGDKAICVLPGSRSGELKRLAEIFRQSATAIAEKHPDAVFVFPTVSYLSAQVTELAKAWPGRTVVVSSISEKFDAMQACDVAMAASGTVSLELAMARVPHIVAYRMNALTVRIVKLLHGMNQKFVNLVNILLDREIIPEFIQERCRSDLIADYMCKLLDDPAVRDDQMKSIDSALSMIRPESGSPSDAAASVVASLLGPVDNPK